MPYSKLCAKTTIPDEDTLFYVDGGADTCNCAAPAWHHESFSGRYVNVADYEKNGTIREKVPIGTSITAVDLPDRTALIRCHEATQMDDANSLASTFQLREADCTVDDIARRHKGGQYIGIDDDVVLPLQVRGALLALKTRKPTEQELDDNDIDIYEITSPHPWHPDEMNEEEITPDVYAQMQTEYASLRHLNLKKSKFAKPDPADIDQFFLYPGKEACEKTIAATTQYGLMTNNWPFKHQKRNINSVLGNARMHEGMSTDPVFSTVPSYEGYNMAQVCIGLDSKRAFAFGMVTEGEGPNTLLDLARNIGVPTGLVYDNSKVMASKQWKQYMRRFWIKEIGHNEPGRPWTNPFERSWAHIMELYKKLKLGFSLAVMHLHGACYCSMCLIFGNTQH